MTNKTNLNLVYDYLHEVKKPTSLNQIWQAISGDVISQKKDEISVIADLYGDMVLDNRFALTSDSLWALSIDPEVEDIKRQFANNFVDESEKKSRTSNSQDDLDDQITILDEDDYFNQELDEDYDDEFYDENDDYDDIEDSFNLDHDDDYDE
ncbi:DNA-directed RNA polymerase subunit delta [Mycoplasma putrefaciens]|uniref:DNA-directed RNA polymerase subunit delta n=1 Tax=Mycoplasma putrefaciens TaxID=2123 RepID=UPI003DA46BAC